MALIRFFTKKESVVFKTKSLTLSSVVIIASFVFIYFVFSGSAAQKINYQDIKESPGENWLTYSGDYRSLRHSPLDQINRKNVSKLKRAWIFHIEGGENLRVTPLVHNGVMYVTKPNVVYALEAQTGKLIWQWTGSLQDGLNRGVALSGDMVFLVTTDCRLVALNKNNGKFVWETKYADQKMGYYSTAAPLALKDRIVIGTAGGPNGARGFVVAFSMTDGSELWRVWAVPTKGEPGSETWGGFNLEKGGVATWMTGSYDPELNLVYWMTGSPYPIYDGDVRPGDNLFSNSVLAIDADSGKTKWYFQFLPHDIHEWDSNEIPILVDMLWDNQPRKLLLQANRNGFFYVLDRVSGEFLLGKPFAKVTWATGLDTKGRPINVPSVYVPWTAGVKGICPGLVGATNWMSPSYNPATGLFYVVVLEHCDQNRGKFYLRALEPQTGEIKWENLMDGSNFTTVGTLSTAGGLVFTGNNKGRLSAFDAQTGVLLGSFMTRHVIFASPMTYAVNKKQYVAIASGSNIVAFSLD